MSPGDVSPVEPPKWHKDTARALRIPPGPTLARTLAGSLLTPLRAGEHALERTSCCLVTQVCPTLCDPVDCSTSGPPFLHHLLEFAQTHVHWVSDAIQPSHPQSPLLLPCLQSFSTSGSFPMSSLFASGGQSIGASASVFPMNIQD